MEKIKQVIVPRKWEAFVRVRGNVDRWEVWVEEIEYLALVEDEDGVTTVEPMTDNCGDWIHSVVTNYDNILEKISFGITGWPGEFELRELYKDDVAEWFKVRRNN